MGIKFRYDAKKETLNFKLFLLSKAKFDLCLWGLAAENMTERKRF